MSEYSKTAISWMGLRDALLYFPYVIPLLEGEHLTLQTAEERELFKAQTEQLLPPDISEAALKDLERLRESYKTLAWHVIRQWQAIKDAEQSSINRPTVMERLFHLAVRGKHGEPTNEAIISFFVHYKSSMSFPFIYGGTYAEDNKIETEDIAVTIASLKLIDTRNIPIEQLFEIRKDPLAMNSLRRFRLFAYENYIGKSREYVEDDILTRLDDYENAAKSVGLQTTSAAITTILDSKLIAGGVAGSFVSAYLHAPITPIATALGAGGFAIGKLAVELSKQSVAKRDLMQSNPVSYISYAKEKLEGK